MVAGSPEFEVLLTDGAEQDLESIYDYIAEYDSIANAQYVLDRMSQVVESLTHFPHRGSYPKELVELGIKAYRQTSFKPYRLIYSITDNQVLIHLIADGRRNMSSLLERRLLNA
ncbi:MAG: type II toxin-antitoxin system RelE/ParE family toxin [Brachymonas sp.]|nr:type II toxin-antitoxin system RelE/ParE family toxin [Brachymonas sp.]